MYQLTFPIKVYAFDMILMTLYEDENVRVAVGALRIQ